MYFFTADTHFGHANIIKYCDRPFRNVDEMDEALIANWNSKISASDTVFHLGDFCFGKNDNDFYKYFFRLNGKKILIKGNHESLAWKNRNAFSDSCAGYYELEIENHTLVLCHYAMKVWNKSHFGSWHLYGHSHNLLEDDIHSLSFDCGVDGHDYYPYSFEEIKERMSKKNFVTKIDNIRNQNA